MAYGDCPHGRKGTPIIGNYVSCPAECTPKAQEYYLGNGTWTVDPVDLSKIKKAPKQMVNAWASSGYLAPSPVHSPSQPSGTRSNEVSFVGSTGIALTGQVQLGVGDLVTTPTGRWQVEWIDYGVFVIRVADPASGLRVKDHTRLGLLPGDVLTAV
jgi:hypothetical protein